MTEPLPRLSGMDSSFLTLEGNNAHMHVGWAALFAWPRSGSAPSFEALRRHAAARLSRAPRCRQRVAMVPFDFEAPVWVDDERFDLDHHVRRLPGRDFRRAADEALSQPLHRDRPLWELWIADELEGGRIGVVGKAHHAMVDGIAAVELAMLLVDTEEDAVAPPEVDEWTPGQAPSPLELLGGATRSQVGRLARVARAGAGVAASMAGLALDPRRMADLPGAGAAKARALGHALAPAPTIELFGGSPSPQRTLCGLRRPLADVATVKRALGGTVNDVVLAAVAGGLHRYAARRGEPDIRPKVMVPVNVRGQEDPTALGNRISFAFLDLPCDEPGPLARLEAVKTAMRARKHASEPQTAGALLDMLENAPRPLQGVVARLMASRRAFNLVVSNIPGPAQPLYMLGCPLEEVYPVVPIAEGHPVSIGFTTVQGEGFFGVHADAGALPDAKRLAGDIGAALDELRELALRVSGEAVPRAGKRFRRAAAGSAASSAAGSAASSAAGSAASSAAGSAASSGATNGDHGRGEVATTDGDGGSDELENELETAAAELDAAAAELDAAAAGLAPVRRPAPVGAS